MDENGPVRRRALLAGLALAAAACAPAPGSGPIGPDQRFSGRVNGSADAAVVTTVCPGPAGGSGHPAAGQTVAAVLDPAGDGDTDGNGAVFVEPDAGTHVVQLHSWGEAVELPTDLALPCDGPGVFVFDPCFGFVGCRGAARADVVRVTFVNVAA